MPFSFRQVCLLGSAVAFTLVIVALLLEHVAHFYPCSLCLLQRYVLIALGMVFLIAAGHQPLRYGQYSYGILLVVLSGIGIALAGRHVWLLHLPVNEQAPCGPSLEYLLNNFPLIESLKVVLKGTAECSETTDLFLGLTLPMWSLLTFIAFFVYSLYFCVIRRFFSLHPVEK